jgi:uncharacterized membrane protein YczE
VSGLAVLAFGEVLILKAHVGVMPWDVLNQGLVERIGLSVGQWSMIVGGVVLLAWIPLRERPGVGTVVNVALTGLGLDAFSAVLPTPDGVVPRTLFLVIGLLLNGLGTAAYIGSRLGAGPRDGLMTGFVRVTGRSVRLVRTCIEVAVVVIGSFLGGNLGIGTVVFALGIGPVVHVFLPLMTRLSQPADPDVAPLVVRSVSPSALPEKGGRS